MNGGQTGVHRVADANLGTKALAFVGPLLLLSLFLPWAVPAPPGDLSARAQAIEADLNATDPVVLVLGNSLVGSGIDPGMLATKLGLPRQKVLSIPISGSEPPTWLALLNNRVYRTGHQPKLVILYDYLFRLHVVSPTNEMSARSLAEQLADGELAPSLATQPSPLVRRVRLRRDEARSSVIDDLKLSVARRIWGELDSSLLIASLGRTFADENVVRADRGAALPFVHSKDAPAQAQSAQELDIERTLIPQIAALVRQNGGTLILAAAGRAPNNSTWRRTSNETERRALDYMNREHIAWLDLRDAAPNAVDYTDRLHLSPAGRAKVTAALVQRLIAGDALTAPSFPPAVLPIPITHSERSGEPQLAQPQALRVGKRPCVASAPMPRDLASLSHVSLAASLPDVVPPFHVVYTHERPPIDDPACTGKLYSSPAWLMVSPMSGAESATGDGAIHLVADPLPDPITADSAWVFPGTTLSFSFTVDNLTDDASLVVRALRLGSSGTPLSFTVDGLPARGASFGRVSAMTTPLRSRSGEHTITVTSPPNGAYGLVRQVFLSQDGVDTPILGTANATFDPSVRLVGTPRRQQPAPGEPVASHTVSAPALDIDPVVVGHSKTLAFRVLPPPQSGPSFWRFNLSPLRVVTDPPSDADLKYVLSAPDGPGKAGTVTVTEANVPVGTKLRVVVDPLLNAHSGVWVPPGDTFTVRATPQRVWIGADTFAIGGKVERPTTSVLHLRVLADDVEIIARDVPMAKLSIAQPLDINLPYRLPTNAREVMLEVRTPPDAPWLQIATAALETRSPYTILRKPPIDNTAGTDVASGAVELTRRALGGVRALEWKRMTKPCLFEASSDELDPLAWSNLRRLGVLSASPIVIAYQGAALPSRGGPFFAGERCEPGGLVVKGKVLAQAGDANGLAVELNPALPLHTANGDFYWLYPHGEVDVPLPEGTQTLRVQAATISPNAGFSAKVGDDDRGVEASITNGQVALEVPVATGARSATLYSDGFSLLTKLEAVDSTGGATPLIPPSSVKVP